MIKIAIPNKGALSEGALALVQEAGYRCSRSGRELTVTDAANGIEFVFLRPRDIAVYVSQGIIDIGITGRDLNFDAANPAFEALKLGFGRSVFRYAVPNDSDLTPDTLGGKRIACSYANIVRRDLQRRGVDAEIVTVDGAVEISVRLGVADAVADVVESGRTLQDAGLKTVGEPVMESEAIVVAKSQAAVALPGVAVFLRRLEGIILAREYAMIEYDVPRTIQDDATAITPGIEAPTVMPLNDPAWVAVKAMIKKKGVNDVIDKLHDIGARGIVLTDIRTCRL